VTFVAGNGQPPWHGSIGWSQSPVLPNDANDRPRAGLAHPNIAVFFGQLDLQLPLLLLALEAVKTGLPARHPEQGQQLPRSASV
jgi:hypothetical protein